MDNSSVSKKHKPLKKSKEKDLLKNKFLLKFMKSRWFPGVFQVPVAIIFAFIVFELLAGPSEAHNNFGTAGTWVLWWPLLPVILLFFGRFWCAVCPFGYLNDIVQKFVGSKKPVPKFLSKYGIWIIDAIFLMITWSDHVWGIVESPRGSGILLLMITTAVVLSGAIFERRTWCRYLCFLGGVSGNYSRAGMLKLRATPEICKNCTVQACYKGNEKAEGCPMFEFPRVMDSSAECNLCGNCVKSCPNGSITLKTAVPTSELWVTKKPKLEVSFLAIIIMGIVFVQNITMLKIWNEVLQWIEKETGLTNYYIIFTVTFLIAMAIPVLLLMLTGLIAKRFNGSSVKNNFAKFGYAIIALDMAGHIAHNLFHLLAEGKSVFYSFMGVFGMDAHEASTALLNNGTIQSLQYILIAIGTFGSIYTAYRIAKSSDHGEGVKATTITYGILMVIFAVANILLFSLPMAMRM